MMRTSRAEPEREGSCSSGPGAIVRGCRRAPPHDGARPFVAHEFLCSSSAERHRESISIALRRCHFVNQNIG
jgi:hypothetical protein